MAREGGVAFDRRVQSHESRTGAQTLDHAGREFLPPLDPVGWCHRASLLACKDASDSDGGHIGGE